MGKINAPPGGPHGDPQRRSTFWAEPATVGVLTSRDVPQLLRLVQKATGLSQPQIGLMIGKSQGEISEIMSGGRRVISIEILIRIVEGFEMPDVAAATFLLGRAVALDTDPLPAHAVSPGTNTLQNAAEGPSHWAAWYGAGPLRS
jgi:transcriptional regulator with XRE-family HTH domain